MKKTTSIIITLLRTLADELEQTGETVTPETPAPSAAPKKRGRPAAQTTVDVPTNTPAVVTSAAASPGKAGAGNGGPGAQLPVEGQSKALTYEDLRALCMPMIKNPPHNEVVKTTIREFIEGDGGLKKLAEHPEHHSAFEAKIMAYRNENNLH